MRFAPLRNSLVIKDGNDSAFLPVRTTLSRLGMVLNMTAPTDGRPIVVMAVGEAQKGKTTALNNIFGTNFEKQVLITIQL